MLQRRPKTGEAGKKKTKKQKQNKISLSGCRPQVDTDMTGNRHFIYRINLKVSFLT